MDDLCGELGRVCIRGTLGDAALNAVDFETARICGDMRGYWVLWVQVPEGQDEVAKIWRRDGGTACETTPPEVEA